MEGKASRYRYTPTDLLLMIQHHVIHVRVGYQLRSGGREMPYVDVMRKIILSTMSIWTVTTMRVTMMGYSARRWRGRERLAADVERVLLLPPGGWCGRIGVGGLRQGIQARAR